MFVGYVYINRLAAIDDSRYDAVMAVTPVRACMEPNKTIHGVRSGIHMKNKCGHTYSEGISCQ